VLMRRLLNIEKKIKTMTLATQTLSCANCQHYSAQSWGDGWNEPRETQESCTKSQWEFEEPSPSPVTGCELFEFAIADEYVEEIIDLDEF
jgi:hypothetical protein